ncbi:hypothetical protein R0K05_21865, partial [Planococcus sp. SIMBA_160]
RPRGRKPVYFAIRQHGRATTVSIAPSPPWMHADTEAGIVTDRRLAALDRLADRHVAKYQRSRP